MKRLPVLIMAFLALNCLAETAWSKGAIKKIVIDSENLPMRIEITDPEILDKFTIWSGPGVGGWDLNHWIASRAAPDFIIDWTLSFPKAREIFPDRHAYLVTFYIEGRAPPKDTYEVAYEVDNKAPRGYVYLPSYPNDDFGQWNTFQISRGVEGSWFYATNEWDEVIRPLMGKE